jgi:hypothetical protein
MSACVVGVLFVCLDRTGQQGGPHPTFTPITIIPKPTTPPAIIDRALVRLLPSHEEVEIRCSELGEVGEAPRGGGAGGGGQRQQQQQRDSAAAAAGSGRGDRERERGGGKRDSRERDERGGDAKRRRGGSREREQERESDRHRGGSGGGSHQHKPGHDKRRGGGGASSSSSSSSSSGSDASPTPPPARATWLFPSIRVRVLDKRLAGGALYLKKGVVVDVHPGALADVAVEETRQVVQLPEAQLETVVPKEAGKPVQVVAGQWRGRRGRLLQASRSGGGAAVQLVGDMAIVRLALDDVAEYMGAIDDEDE